MCMHWCQFLGCFFEDLTAKMNYDSPISTISCIKIIYVPLTILLNKYCICNITLSRARAAEILTG